MRIGEIESKFADIIWANEPLTSAELVKICEKELNWKRTTTYTVLKRLSERGMFQNKEGTVTSLVAKSDFYATQSKEFVDETFGGSLPAFIAAFTSKKDLNKKDLDEIRKLIDMYGEDR